LYILSLNYQFRNSISLNFSNWYSLEFSLSLFED